MIKIQMALTKSTKGTHVYADSSHGAPVPTLYIKKGALPSPPPETITVSVDTKGEPGSEGYEA